MNKQGKMLFGRKLKFVSTAVLFLAMSYSTSWSQGYKVSTDDKKATKYYFEGRAFAKRGQFAEAIDVYNKAIDRDSEFFEVYYGLGNINERLGEEITAINFYNKGLTLDPSNSPNIHFSIGNLYYKNGEYDTAIIHLQNYIDWKLASNGRIQQAKKVITSCRYAIQEMKTPLSFKPRKLESPLNMFPIQYFPALTVDQQQLFFTMRRGTRLIDDEDIYVSSKTGDEWSSPVSISQNINTDQNQGANAISADGRKLIFTSCNERGGLGSCDLYISEKVGDDWSTPKNLGSRVNSRSWESQPSLSADGRTLYFSSDRPGGFGSRDIWKAEQDKYGDWQQAVNLGEEINTKGEETSPFIHANGQTLYFASNHYLGFGGFDFYRTDFSEDKWTEPRNLGYPLNDHEDQISFFMTGDARFVYFSKELGEDPKTSKSSLFMFEVPEELKVENNSTFLKGVIRDNETKKPLRAQIELYDLNAKKLISRFFSDEVTGEYLSVLTKGGQYGLYVKKRNYMFENSSFDLREKMLDKPLIKDVYLRPVKKGEKVTLNNIFFAFDKHELDDKSKVELKEVYKFLRANPRRVIEIQAHTDNKGSGIYNQELSDKRAQSVYDYLISKRVPARMLTYKGYGASNPITDNNTEENRQRNRRVEFEVVQ